MEARSNPTSRNTSVAALIMACRLASVLVFMSAALKNWSVQFNCVVQAPATTVGWVQRATEAPAVSSRAPVPRSASLRAHLSLRRCVSPEESGYCTVCSERYLPLTGSTSHMQKQGFENLRLKQRAQVFGGKSRVVPTESSECHACGHECRYVRPQSADLV